LTLVQIPAVDANSAVLQAMTDAQNGLNAYQLSGDRTLLQPYFGTHGRTISSLATLHDVLVQEAEDKTEAALHGALEERQGAAVEQWWTTAMSVEQALSRGERTDAFHGRALFDRFRASNTVLAEHLTAERDQTRLAARAMLSRGQIVTISAALASLLGMLLLGRRVARSITGPLTDLRDAVLSQRNGEPGTAGREDRGPTEIRSLAVSFNELTARNLALRQSQTRALGGHQITSEIGRVIRSTSDTQEALDAACGALGEGLGADRVLASTVGGDLRVLLTSQWHRPDLQPVPDLTLLPGLGEVAEEMWLSGSSRTREDLLVSEVPEEERIREFSRMTGARASVMVPIGFGDRVIGSINVLMTGGPRDWDASETDVVRVVAGFVARAIVETEDQSLQREYVERVERLDRLKSDFLGTVSHELRTPLTSISGYLELLQDGDVGELSAQQSAMLEVISRSTSRLRGLIEDVMMLNRIEGGVTKDNFAEVSTRALIIRVTEELMPLAGSGGIELEIDAGPPGATVLGDRASLDRAVVNILSNAIKFSHRGGVVSITGVIDSEADRVLIICQDRGLGIPDDDRGDLFTRFFRASNATNQSIPGTGLGLSIAKQIVEDHHGGQLRLISVEGEGTTVVIDLPCYPREQALATPGNDSMRDGVFGIRA